VLALTFVPDMVKVMAYTVFRYETAMIVKFENGASSSSVFEVLLGFVYFNYLNLNIFVEQATGHKKSGKYLLLHYLREKFKFKIVFFFYAQWRRLLY
jgi:hypothetical protein